MTTAVAAPRPFGRFRARPAARALAGPRRPGTADRDMRVPGRLPAGAAGDAAGQELSGQGRGLRRSSPVSGVFPDAGAAAIDRAHAGGRRDGDRGDDSAGIHVCLRLDAELHAAEGDAARYRADTDPRAVAAARDLVHSVVRHAGAAEVDAGRRLGVWPDRHHHQLDLCGVSACIDDHIDVASVVGRAPVRGGGIARHTDIAQVFYHHLARREVRSDQRGDGGFFLFRQRIRHPEGHRWQLQRARTRHFQAGHRAAELQQGRGRQHRAAGAGLVRVRRRLGDAGAAAGPVLVARRGLRAETQALVRRADVRLLPVHLRASAGGARHGGLHVVHQAVAVRQVVQSRPLHVRPGRRRA